MKATKKTIRRKAGKPAQSKYACGVCGAVVEVDPGGGGRDSAAAVICFGKKMAKKRAP